MKIFIVSEAGKIADVTLHTSCKSADESALKVKILTIHWRQLKVAGGMWGMNAQQANSIESCCVGGW